MTIYDDQTLYSTRIFDFLCKKEGLYIRYMYSEKIIKRNHLGVFKF